MADAQTLEDMSPGLSKVVERAKREPEGRFNSLAPLIDVAALQRAYHRPRADAAVGVDGVSKEAYGQNLEVIYEQGFLDCSHGFRPGRNAHGAVRTPVSEPGQGTIERCDR